jgi:hypothetical protein
LPNSAWRDSLDGEHSIYSPKHLDPHPEAMHVFALMPCFKYLCNDLIMITQCIKASTISALVPPTSNPRCRHKSCNSVFKYRFSVSSSSPCKYHP